MGRFNTLRCFVTLLVINVPCQHLWNNKHNHLNFSMFIIFYWMIYIHTHNVMYIYISSSRVYKFSIFWFVAWFPRLVHTHCHLLDNLADVLPGPWPRWSCSREERMHTHFHDNVVAWSAKVSDFYVLMYDVVFDIGEWLPLISQLAHVSWHSGRLVRDNMRERWALKTWLWH